MQRLKATLCMVAAKFSVAAFTVSYKLAANDGMNMKVLITYRYLFASILILPLALFLERYVVIDSSNFPILSWLYLV
ncbi:hypothetical protein Hdeb2414_s0014g00424801 [Helianthus debilis subsp. tardiflorus]